MISLCVFCGASPGRTDDYLEGARTLGQLLAKRDITLVYGGGSTGLMGALANATLEAGGRAVGVIPRQLWDKDAGHRKLSDLFIVDSMVERRTKMSELADGFIVLPGGIRSLAAFFEVWSCGVLGMHDKPLGVFDVKGYWRSLLDFLENMVSEGFLKAELYAQVKVTPDAEALLAALEGYIALKNPLVA